MVTKLIFSGFVALLAVQRLWELRKSECHRKALLAKGGKEYAYEHFPFMALLHSMWLVAMVVEVWVFDRVALPLIAVFAILLFLLGQFFRLVAMHTLGERWCARIITLPDRPPIAMGIYRYMRHPNYVGVVLEIAATPMIHGAFLTAIIFSVLNCWLLKVRISAEEKAVYG